MDINTLICAVRLLEERVSQLESQLNNQQIKSKECRFTAPSLEDVADYFLERMPNSNTEDSLHFADVFISHYTNTGWKYGKNKMKDWKAAVRSAWDLSKFVTTKNQHNDTIGRIQRNSLHEWVNA